MDPPKINNRIKEEEKDWKNPAVIISKWSSILVLPKINGKITKKVKRNVKKL